MDKEYRIKKMTEAWEILIKEFSVADKKQFFKRRSNFYIKGMGEIPEC
ncbi:MAG: hypothetical protein GXW90_06110 [Tepidanaerobacter acetatoxydans]|jgi:hypothetical protein|nr:MULTISPECIES: hypothetical protein [Tepidanaerobacter]NLU10499.1 hypothetical protein [Tepidanaerobacter acetatoxydans]